MLTVNKPFMVHPTVLIALSYIMADHDVLWVLYGKTISGPVGMVWAGAVGKVWARARAANKLNGANFISKIII